MAVLLAYVTFDDQRGGGIETAFKGDKQELGLTTRNTCAGIAWFFGPQCGGLSAPMAELSQDPTLRPLRMVRDVFYVSGLLRFDVSRLLLRLC